MTAVELQVILCQLPRDQRQIAEKKIAAYEQKGWSKITLFSFGDSKNFTDTCIEDLCGFDPRGEWDFLPLEEQK